MIIFKRDNSDGNEDDRRNFPNIEMKFEGSFEDDIGELFGKFQTIARALGYPQETIDTVMREETR